jgi:hypothetical protein
VPGQLLLIDGVEIQEWTDISAVIEDPWQAFYQFLQLPRRMTGRLRQLGPG